MPKKIALCTGGGDCAGVNSALASAARYIRESYQAQVQWIHGGYEGLIQDPPAVSESLNVPMSEMFFKGGTTLGTANHGSPFKDPTRSKQVLSKMLASLERAGIDTILCIGGDGTHGMSRVLAEAGIRIIGLVKTIDNDMPFCDQTIGFSTAVENTSRALETLRTTAQSLQRLFFVETMGRHSGFLALHAGIAADCELIILPELPYDLEQIAQRLKELPLNLGAVIIVSEGAFPKGGSPYYLTNASGKKVLGGGAAAIAKELHQNYGFQTRDFSIGYLSRGGHPNAEDRLLATRWAYAAVEEALCPSSSGKSGVICYQNGQFKFVSFADIPANTHRQLNLDDPLLQQALARRICLSK